MSVISSACSPQSGCDTSRSSVLHAQLARVADVQRVLGVDERAHAARALRLGDDVQRQRRLARRLGPVHLDDAPARQPARAERDVQPQRPVETTPASARRALPAPPSRMIAPLPNCFSISPSTAPTAFSFGPSFSLSLSLILVLVLLSFWFSMAFTFSFDENQPNPHL